MPARLYHLVIDAHDPRRLARFWADVLEYPVPFEDDEEVIIGASVDRYPGLCFLRVEDDKVTKNRLHIDLDPDDRDVEVARLLALGATPLDIGQGPDVTWVVLADPEGNEFCVLRPHRTLIS